RYGTQEATRNSDSVRFSSADSWMRNGAGIRQSVHNLFILQNIGYTYLTADAAGHKVSTNQSMVFMPQQVYFLNSALPAATYYAHAGQTFCAIDVHIKASSLMSMLEESGSKLPDDFQNMVAGDAIGHVLAPLQLTPHMQRLLQQIWQCPYQGLTRSLFLEAKSLELIALYIQAAQEGRRELSSLRDPDIESIRQAQHILRKNLQAPPSLMELARQVGINDRKLKQGFREVLDTTVFGYLTQQRMEVACRLLKQERTVAAVAATVGYGSPTAFSGAFRRKFGMTPKAYQLSNSQRQ
ncbi:MAG: AraC family transcriptional regulator, partial [Cyanobacteria bacterium P01_D01_bin.105]